jgi:hypothetical protein
MARKTKAQLAEEAELRQRTEAIRRREAAQQALYWTHEVAPDVMPPEGSGIKRGWFARDPHVTFYSINDHVTLGCSGAVSHNTHNPNHTSTQGARLMHSTRLRALHALRAKAAFVFGDVLAKIDAEIAREEAAQEKGL